MSTVILYPTTDTYVAQGQPNTDFRTETKLRINNPLPSDGLGVGRAWLIFDLSSIGTATINSAVLKMFTFYPGGINYVILDLPIKRSTNITWPTDHAGLMTWNNADNASVGSSEGTLSFDTTLANQFVDSTDLSAAVQAALSSGKLSLRLDGQDEISGDGGLFTSTEQGAVSDGLHTYSVPMLTVDYTPSSSSRRRATITITN